MNKKIVNKTLIASIAFTPNSLGWRLRIWSKYIYICECVYIYDTPHFGNRWLINRQGGGVEVSFYLHLSTGYFRASRFFHETMREYRSRWARSYLSHDSKQIRSGGEGGGATRGDKAIPTIPLDADWRARARALHVIRTFDGGRLPWKWRNFFRHFLARGKQITFHSWHLLFRWRPRLNASAIRIRLNKEAIWFSPFCIPHISFFFPPVLFAFSCLLSKHESESQSD